MVWEERRWLTLALSKDFVLYVKLVDPLVGVFSCPVELKVHALMGSWHMGLELGILSRGESELGSRSIVLFARFRNLW